MDVNSTLRACPICRNGYSGITEIAASFFLYCISYIIKFMWLELAKIPLTFLSFMNSYEGLKPPSSPSPSPPGNSSEESLETSTPVDGVPQFINGNGSLAEDVQEELIFYHSPFPVYEDLKPPTSPTPTTPNSLATSMASDGAESQTASLSNNGPVESIEA
ncbi:protein TIC 62, chloroplastic-like isoform X2 [Chenopodium quinoa]|nr:protein TIC 62, chloroplastic-like isoform X2 [Chenopodium quinoa]XP_021741970.1 protein TIC 62, chloroplastic-like isoform X2 [Chenopodium quinoa]